MSSTCTTNLKVTKNTLSLFDALEMLPSVLKVNIMRRYAELKVRDYKLELFQEIENERNFCAKCGEHSILLSTLGLCHGCVEYGYSRGANGMLVPNDIGYKQEANLNNNLFALDMFV